MARASVSTASYLILQAIASGYRYGFDIMDATGMPSGSVYPALRRFERDGLVRARWENASIAQEEGRPPRRYYELTAAGEGVLAASRERYHAMARLTGPPARRPRTA